jgi:hypothetical protein
MVDGADFVATQIIVGYIKKRKSRLAWQKLASQE